MTTRNHFWRVPIYKISRAETKGYRSSCSIEAYISKLTSSSGNRATASGGKPNVMLPLLSPEVPFTPFHSLIRGRTTSISFPRKWKVSSPFINAVTEIYFPSRKPHCCTLFLALCVVARTLDIACMIIPVTCKCALSSAALGTIECNVTPVIFGMFRKVFGGVRRRRLSPPRGPRSGRFLKYGESPSQFRNL